MLRAAVGAGGRRGRGRAGAGGGPGVWPGPGLPCGVGRRPEGGSRGGTWRRPERPGRAINPSGADSGPPRLSFGRGGAGGDTAKGRPAGAETAGTAGARGGDVAPGRGSALLPAPPGSPRVPGVGGGGGPWRGGAGPSRARRSRHGVSHPPDSFPKKHFLLPRSGVKACVGRAGAHSPRVPRCRRRRWGAGAPCPGAEPPPDTPLRPPPRSPRRPGMTQPHRPQG